MRMLTADDTQTTARIERNRSYFRYVNTRSLGLLEFFFPKFGPA
jgi:hypothetical protein